MDNGERLTRLRQLVRENIHWHYSQRLAETLREWIDDPTKSFVGGTYLLQSRILTPLRFTLKFPLAHLTAWGFSPEDIEFAEAHKVQILQPLLEEAQRRAARQAGLLKAVRDDQRHAESTNAERPTPATYVRAAQPQGQLAGNVSGLRAAPAASTTAIIAWHGMGQQLPFETVETTARALAKKQGQRSGGQEPVVTTRLVQLGDQKLWRAELEIVEDSQKREVHIYEAYWAPLTQGKITLAETVKFLLSAGYHGVRYTLKRPPTFLRYLFGRWVTYKLKPSLTLVFVGLLVTLLSLVAMNFAITTAVSVKLLTGGGGPTSWPSYSLLADLTIDFGWLESVLGVNATDVVHSGDSGNNGGYHTYPAFLEELPNEDPS